jgi:glycosyltransferase involved in cell wall biosynthesis
LSRSGDVGPRVAFLTHTPPLPAVSGERIRNWNLLRELARRGWEISLFSLVDPAKAPARDDVEQLERVSERVHLEPVAISPLVRRARLARDLALARAFHSSFLVTPAALAACRRWLHEQEPDAILIETHYMAPYVPRELLGRCVFDSHNAESRRLETIARALGRSPRGLVAALQRGAVRRFERELLKHVARATAVSEEEARVFEPHAPGRVDLVPNGVDCEALRPRAALPEGRRLLFLGSLDYSANVDAVSYLVDEILPRLAYEGAELDVVGSHPRSEIFAAARRSSLPMCVAGHVADATPFWENARSLLVPLRIGGGTRLKILEALARGVPVVSTTLGCEGLGLRDGHDLLVADEPESFAASIERLLRDDELCLSLARRGRETVEANYDWRRIGDLLENSLSAVTGS